MERARLATVAGRGKNQGEKRGTSVRRGRGWRGAAGQCTCLAEHLFMAVHTIFS